MSIIRIFSATLLLISVAFITPSVAATNPGYTGTWYNAAQSGHGLNIEVLPGGKLLVIWYTYRADGTSTFLLGVLSGDDGVFAGNLNMTEGMVFGDFDPGTNEEFPWGTINVTFSDCNTALVEWTSSLEGFSDGSTTMQRLTNVKNVNCSNSPFLGNFTLELFDPEEISIGRVIILPTGNLAFITLGDSGTEIGYGNWEQTGEDTLNWDAVSYDEDGVEQTFNGTATATDDGFDGVVNGTTELLGVPLLSYQNNLSQSSMKGTYTVSEADGETTDVGIITVSKTGNVEGNIGICMITGKFKVPDPNFNQFSVDVDYTGCGKGTLVGAGISNNGEHDLIMVDEAEGGGFFFHLEK